MALTKKKLIIRLLNGLLRLAFLLSPRLYRPRINLSAIQPHRILISRPDHIGDAVLATPTIRAVRRRFPGAEIVLAVASWSAPLFAELTEVDEVFIIDPPWWIRKRGTTSASLRERVRHWLRFAGRILELRKRRFELCLELRGDVRQILAFGLATNADTILTYRRNGGHFLADGWLDPRPDRHEALQGLDLAALVGCDYSDPEPKIVAGPGAQGATAALRAAVTSGSEDILVVIHPSAKPANSWPAEHFESLIASMTSDAEVRILLTGAKGDTPLHSRLQAVCPGQVSSCAGLHLNDVAALIASADLVVAPDTGPMHFLNGTTTPSVLLFGPTDPARFAPFGTRHHILSVNWCCSDELHDHCLRGEGPGHCMRALLPATVHAVVFAEINRIRNDRCATDRSVEAIR